MENTENIQVPLLLKGPLNVFKQETYERREKIAKVVALTGIANTRRRAKSLSEEHKVSIQTIYTDINWIIGHWKPENIRETKIDLKVARDRALQEALELVNRTEGKDKIAALQALNSTIKIFREELEAWGEKTKIADKQDVTITGYKFELIKSEKSKV